MREENIEKIMDIVERELRKGQKAREIAELISKNKRYIDGIIDKLVASGRITYQEIEKAKYERTRNYLKNDPRTSRILKYLKENRTLTYIAQALNCDRTTVIYYRERLEKYGLLTQKEIGTDITEKEKNIAIYKSKLQLARKIPQTEGRYFDEPINKLVRELIELAEKMRTQGLLKSEEIKIISDALFQAEHVDVNNVLGIANLHLKMKNYQGSIYILNYSKNFLTKKDDLQRISEALNTIATYKKKIEAKRMMSQGYSLEDIQKRTKLSLSELLELKNAKIKDKQQDPDSQGDDEFTDL